MDKVWVLYYVLIFLILLNLILFVFSIVFFIIKNKVSNRCVGTIRVERLESGTRTWAFSFNEGVDYDMVENMGTVRFKVELKKEKDEVHES